MIDLGGTMTGAGCRADRVTSTGRVRDTVLFSILREEWPTAVLPA